MLKFIPQSDFKQNYTLKLVKKRSKYELIFCTLLIMCVPFSLRAQKDTIYRVDDSFEDIVRTKARDSFYNDFKNKQLHLYGEAELEYPGIKLQADYLMVDFEKKEVLASYLTNEQGERTGIPVFTDGSEKVEAAKIRYNFKSKKGYILEMKVKQDENFLYMDAAKRQANEELHFRKGRFTHCDLEEPHYHFQLSKAILVPQKRIVSGPMNLWIKGVPTPLGLPFMFIPQQKERKHRHGVLFPQYSLQSPYGMGVQNLGYYFPINDSLQTSFYVNLYSRGSWGVSNNTQYKINYKFEGDLQASFQQFRTGFPDSSKLNKLSLRWNHRQNQKANPYWNFSSSINFNSDNTTKTSLEVVNQDYFKNTLTSDVNITRRFPGKPYVAGMKISARQNSISQNIALTSPYLSFNVARFSPFSKLKKKGQVGTRWYEKIMMTYNAEAQNRASFGDSILKQQRYDILRSSMLNGIRQDLRIQSNIGLFGNTWKFNPSLDYGNAVNFLQIRKSYDALNNTTQIDSLQQVGISNKLSFNAQLSTVLYSYYRIIGKNKPLLRHILTPSFSYRFAPNLNTIIEDSVGTNQELISYSPFERSLYPESSSQNTSVLSFGFNNTLELKHKSKKDTVTGFNKVRLIDGFSISGNYDFNKDSMRLSNISTSLRISPLKAINIVSSASFSPYDWNDSTQQSINQYAWKNRGQLARLLNANINTTLVLTSRAGRKKLEQNQDKLRNNWNADYQYFALHPEQYIDFEIPWKINFTHIFDIRRNISSIVGVDKFQFTNTLQTQADFSLTKRWKMIWNVYLDLERQKVINGRLTLTRDMHCWFLSVDWTPIGLNKSFLLRFNATSNLFKDAKIELKKPPELI
ncbi:MAG: LPS-assembly protein LptD [Bacteroidetes bacterium]|nr:MAG: LPS-assembly protein LptD [Bacteroidota bacterium]